MQISESVLSYRRSRTLLIAAAMIAGIALVDWKVKTEMSFGFLYNFSSVWLEFWSQTNTLHPNDKSLNAYYLGVYAMLQILCLLVLALFIKCNDLAVNNRIVIPVVQRPNVTAVKHQLVAELSGWDNNTWDLPNWYREA